MRPSVRPILRLPASRPLLAAARATAGSVAAERVRPRCPDRPRAIRRAMSGFLTALRSLRCAHVAARAGRNAMGADRPVERRSPVQPPWSPKMFVRLPSRTVPALLSGALAMAAGWAAAATLTGPALTVELGDSAFGAATNQNRVDRITWRSTFGTVIDNWVANAPMLNDCADVIEFFGESKFVPNDTSARPPVGPGSVSRWISESLAVGSAKTRPQQSCWFTRSPTPVKTVYALTSEASGINQLKVVRTWQFGSSSDSGLATGLRSYVPRLPAASYPKVLVPTFLSGLVAFNVQDCPDGCTPKGWQGNWFAMEDDRGYGMMVLRGGDSATRKPARIDIRYDAPSRSNATSLLLKVPQGGFRSTVTETQLLCFYDPISWPLGTREILLPAGCAIR